VASDRGHWYPRPPSVDGVSQANGEENEPPVSDEEVLQLAAAALFTAVGEAAKVDVPAIASSPGLQALLSVTLPLIGFAVARGAHRLFAPRAALVAIGFARAFDDDPEKFRRHADEHKDDADFHETMYRTFRAMLDAAEPEVVDTLGYMAGCYAAAGRRPDKFFRGLGRLLCDLEQGELGAFRDLLNGVDGVFELKKDGRLHILIGDQFSHEEVHQRTPHGSSSTIHYEDIVRVVDSDDREGDVGKHPLAKRFFMLLKREGLAGTPPPEGKWDDDNPTGDRALEIARETFETLLRLLAPLADAHTR